MSQALSINDLEKKAWYRAFKIIYIIIILIAVLIVCAASWSTRPKPTLDEYNSLIVCDNGKSYRPIQNDIYIYGYDTELSYYNDKDARVLCKYDTLNFSAYSDEVIAKNYTFSPVYNEAKYGSWFGQTLLALFVVWLFSYLVKACFLYIVIGQKPKINLPRGNK